MSRPSISFLCLGIFVAAFLTLRADDAPVAPDGYKMTKVKLAGGGYIYSQEPDPFRHAPSSSHSDQYKPDNMDFSMTNPMANKQFQATPASISKQDSLVDPHERSSFVTKSFEDPHESAHSVADEDTKFTLPTSSPYSHHSTNFDKSYSTSRSSLGEKKETAYDKTSSDQDHTAILGSQKTDTFAYALASKTYTGVEADEVKKDLARMNEGMMSVKDLPDRPLTIDEVRALINHGVKPDTNAPPPPPSKALNDPDYQRDPEPEPPADPPARVSEDDKNDPVPSPGTMAQPPENTEPLPQR